ncbi:oxidative stress-induced growth inhibitor 2-like [Anopheles darlingi]|uniref:oxidative stress-induced growth inhibitor 2-like n=1 Tax=Anopheles darlingi TaxID=43151 RepID=UPI00210061D9|nr:oxidative stress-induced growth inhibitor 2-like [Anopheles darlingi]
MKDINSGNNGKGNLHKDTIYKDVVIIGNGPSGISLSYMLAGHWPYWVPEQAQKHPDELLRARLNYYDAQKSLVEHDLFSLADGLEGRSTNPVSLLLDSLQHPCADLGMDLPSMVEYRYHAEKEVDHLVLGRGPPGGSWHRMDPNLRTLSLAAWMSLPGLPFAEWEAQHPIVEPLEITLERPLQLANGHGNESVVESSRSAKRKGGINGNRTAEVHGCVRCRELAAKQHRHRNVQSQQKVALRCSKCRSNEPIIDSNNNKGQRQMNGADGQGGAQDANVVAVLDERSGKVNMKLLYPPRRNLSLKRQVSKEVETRALISRVAQYYESYVTEMGLDKYFMNSTIVTTVVPMEVVGGTVPDRMKNGRWIVAGFNTATNKRFTIVCRNLVLANGASDLANRLGVKGEGLQMPWVKYELPHLERALERYDEHSRTELKPVLIVGAGLSAADAVTICRSSGIPVVHVYRNRTAGLDKMLPGNVYPEYHEVHKMMKDSNRKHELYTPLPEHTIVDLSISTSTGEGEVHRVTVQHLKTGERRELEVSYCAILIGSRPDLRFISTIVNGKGTTNGVESNAAPLVISCPDSDADDEAERCFGRPPPAQPLTMWTFTEQLLFSRLGRKLFWFKNMCAKCKHINLTDKTRHKQQQQQQQQYSTLGSHCPHEEIDPSHAFPFVLSATRQQQPLSAASGMGLGEDPAKPIDCKNNPIDVDKYTNAVLRTPHTGLFAMGPLVGDNFVRFIPGGALSITAALHKRTEND